MTQHMSGFPAGTPVPGPPAPPPGTPTTDERPTTQVAKDEAGQVGGTAAEAGRQVTDTTKQQAGQVAEQARREARDLLHEARDQVNEQAKGGQQKATESLRALADELHEMAGGERQGPASDLAAQAADRLGGVAEWLDRREPGDLIGEVRGLARRRPGAFLLGAAVAGIVAGRLTRGVVDASRDTSGGSSGGTGTGTGYSPGRAAAYPPPDLLSSGQPAPTTAPRPYAQPATPAAAPYPYDDASATVPGDPAYAQPPVGGSAYPTGEVPPARHALHDEPTTVGEYVEEVERGTVPPATRPDGPR
jgi:ElaB/YqjD/DUF883 family membrane-anchored ribosome-binding protein